MSQLFTRLADNQNRESWAHRYRAARFDFFKSLLGRLPSGVRILDIGGTQSHWEAMGGLSDARVTLLNIEKQETFGPKYCSVVGSATELDFDDDTFDVAYSNSVIEHLFTWPNQLKMAREIRRVARNYFVQTPNYYFPVEPHWFFPGFHYLPKAARVALTRQFQLGHMERVKDKRKARRLVDEVRLLSPSEMSKLFPDGRIWREKVGPLTKSIVSYRF